MIVMGKLNTFLVLKQIYFNLCMKQNGSFRIKLFIHKKKER